jgi:uncharacterized protein YjbJ (UPF0337 family)
MLDQQTKQQIQQNFKQLKPQIKQAFPDVPEQELSQGQSDPDRLVSSIEQSTGQPKDRIEQRLQQLVGSA